MPAMAGYVAMARVERGRVRAVAWDELGRPDQAGGDEPPAVAAEATASLEPDDTTTIGEHWERLREELAMLSFYLTDPEGWR
jgi:hypothetical protein